MNRRIRKLNSASRCAGAERRARWLKISIAVVLAGYLLYSSILGEMGLVKYYRMKARYNDLVHEISRLKEENRRLSAEVLCLKSDPACIERLARDRLGLARKGEIVYYYDEAGMKEANPAP